MILAYFDINEEITIIYVSPFDKSRFLGERNNFNQVLVGLYVYDHLDSKILSFESANRCLLNTSIRYWEKERVERRKAEWKKLP